MKAITIRQPWATLIALGVKTIETRSWRAPQALIGRRIAIHAGKHRPAGLCSMVDISGVPVGDWLPCSDDMPRRSERFWIEHYGAGMASVTGSALPGDDGYASLALGAVIAVATLADCVPMIAEDNFTIDRQDGHDDWLIIARPFRGAASLASPRLVRFIDPGSGDDGVVLDAQLPYGDFQPGRWAWMLTDIDELAEPIPAKGKQGVWEWTL